MITRVLLAVDDSPAALAAARVGVGLAAACHAQVRIVHVLSDAVLTRALRHPRDLEGGVGERRELAAETLVRHVADLARRAGVDAETRLLEGDPAPRLLDEAQAWDADLVVVGRSDRAGAGQPYVGSEIRHLLEFAERPVLVVPQPAR